MCVECFRKCVGRYVGMCILVVVSVKLCDHVKMSIVACISMMVWV